MTNNALLPSPKLPEAPPRNSQGKSERATSEGKPHSARASSGPGVVTRQVYRAEPRPARSSRGRTAPALPAGTSPARGRGADGGRARAQPGHSDAGPQARGQRGAPGDKRGPSFAPANRVREPYLVTPQLHHHHSLQTLRSHSRKRRGASKGEKVLCFPLPVPQVYILGR